MVGEEKGEVNAEVIPASFDFKCLAEGPEIVSFPYGFMDSIYSLSNCIILCRFHVSSG